MGNAKEARKALQQAAEATRLTAGAGTPTTLIAQSLAESPPKSSAEMAGSYENFRERFDSPASPTLEDQISPHLPPPRPPFSRALRCLPVALTHDRGAEQLRGH